MDTHHGQHLVAVLATPPKTSGARTEARVNLAAEILGAMSSSIVNLLLVPTSDVREMKNIGADEAVWNSARPVIAAALDHRPLVLLGWGHTSPSGRARALHRAQTTWVLELLRRRALDAWTVGGTPRHPSRWQRYTSRTYPDMPFTEAVTAALRPYSF